MPGYLFLYLQEYILLMKEKKLNFRKKNSKIKFSKDSKSICFNTFIFRHLILENERIE